MLCISPIVLRLCSIYSSAQSIELEPFEHNSNFTSPLTTTAVNHRSRNYRFVVHIGRGSAGTPPLFLCYKGEQQLPFQPAGCDYMLTE